MKRVAYHPLARSELIAAALYYEERRPGFGSTFLTAVEKVEKLLTQFPEVGQPYEAGTRKFRVRGFPLTVVYTISTEEIRVIAVAHFSREPGYWVSRLNG